MTVFKFLTASTNTFIVQSPSGLHMRFNYFPFGINLFEIINAVLRGNSERKNRFAFEICYREISKCYNIHS